MTIFYPDISHYQAGLMIQPGTVAVCAKASQGTTFHDPCYTGFAAQAAEVGAFFFAYHWLRHGDIDAQAASCHAVVGTTPVMIDCEDRRADPSTVADCLAFASALRELGGVCALVYLPHWYWQDHLSSPNLAPLAQAGLSLVSSNYKPYSDTGPGWTSYGGVAPAIWQYTETQPYGGVEGVDFDAFRGTVGQLRALVTGTSPSPPTGPGAPAWPGREFRRTSPEMTGTDIRTWQQRMHERGWTISVDGGYGPQSESVCQRFQQDSTDHNWPLDVDGVVGPNTWRASWERPTS